MRVERSEGSKERTVLTSMVTDKTVLTRIASRWDRSLFGSTWANLIAGWCVDYHTKYQEAPGKAIAQMYSSWADSTDDQDTARLVDRFLSSLSEEYEQGEQLNPDLVLDIAGKHFNQIRISRLLDQVQGDMDLGDLEAAEKRLRGYGRLEMGSGCRHPLFSDPQEVTDSFSEELHESIVHYPGATGRFFQNNLEREGFIAFLGPEKSGKSWWLLDMAMRAVQQRRRVAFFEVGDMSERQIKRRFYSRVARHPYRSPDGEWPFTVRIPSSINLPEEPGNPAKVQFTERKFKAPLDRVVTKVACEEMMRYKVRSKKPYFYLSVHPNSTMTVAGIKSTLQMWALEDGWIPDVVICDYADILASPYGIKETRDQINATWKQLRALSQELHCLLVTATQADAASYDKALLDRRNFSEDHRKLAHCTGLVGINVTGKEKEVGLSRLNWIVLRDSEFSVARVVHCAGCLSIANPCMKSVM